MRGIYKKGLGVAVVICAGLVIWKLASRENALPETSSQSESAGTGSPESGVTGSSSVGNNAPTVPSGGGEASGSGAGSDVAGSQAQGSSSSGAPVGTSGVAGETGSGSAPGQVASQGDIAQPETRRNAKEAPGERLPDVSGSRREPEDLTRAASQVNVGGVGSSAGTQSSGAASEASHGARGSMGKSSGSNLASTSAPVGQPTGAAKAPSGGAPTNLAPSAPPEKARPNFPGIDQKENELMVSSVRHRDGEGEDFITVTLTRTDGTGEISGVLWVIGEYVQRGTTGIMYMPSHNDLKLGPDGKPKNPQAGMPFQLRGNVEKKLSVRRPGFEGEELTGVTVGVVNKSTHQIHYARVSMRQMKKPSNVKRAKVKTP